MAQAVTLTITKWEILPNAQTVRITGTGSDGRNYSIGLPDPLLSRPADP